jgi:acyl carrier protein
MNQLSEDELFTLMNACMGELGRQLDRGSFLDMTFDDLDFDSLAQVELGERLRERRQIDLPEDLAEHVESPRALLAWVNELILAR